MKEGDTVALVISFFIIFKQKYKYQSFSFLNVSRETITGDSVKNKNVSRETLSKNQKIKGE